jgi:hypothetical protein
MWVGLDLRRRRTALLVSVEAWGEPGSGTAVRCGRRSFGRASSIGLLFAQTPCRVRLERKRTRNLSAAEYLEAVNHRRSALLTALGGVLLLASAFFTWSQIQVAREGQVTDRFTKAVDQLGSKDRHVRLGGIHALARTSGSGG